jgi:hypothetical protein
MQLKFTVHNPHDTPISKMAEIGGELTSVSINGFEVELKSDDLSHGGMKLRFFGSAATEARALFVNDAPIVVSLSTPAAE